MSDSLPRWVKAQASGFAHLDFGERSRQSLRVFGEHIIVTACRATLLELPADRAEAERC